MVVEEDRSLFRGSFKWKYEGKASDKVFVFFFFPFWPFSVALHIPNTTYPPILKRVSYLASWCFEPSQPQRITSGLNTNFTLSPSYSFHKPSYHKSCFLSLFIFRGHSAREPASSRVTYLILKAYTGTGVSHSKHRKESGEVWQKCGWMDLKSRNSKEETPGSRRSMYGYILTYSRL